MDILVEKENNVTIVKLEGNFDIAASKPFDDKIEAIINDGEKNIHIDFTSVPFIESTGLRMLLKSAQSIKDKNGLFLICNSNTIVKEVFTMTGFDSILSLYESVDAGMKEVGDKS